MHLLPKEGHPDFDATDIIKFLDCIVVLFNTSVLVRYELYIDLYIVLTTDAKPKALNASKLT